MPGAREILTWLRERYYPLALATSGGRRHVDFCLDRFALREHFLFVRTREDVNRRKPDPEIYLRCSTDLGIEPERMLVVEDSLHGVRAAKAAGAHCVGLRSEHTPAESLTTADLQIESLLDLQALF